MSASAAFNQIDANHDGVISRSEFNALMGHGGTLTYGSPTAMPTMTYASAPVATQQAMYQAAPAQMMYQASTIPTQVMSYEQVAPAQMVTYAAPAQTVTYGAPQQMAYEQQAHMTYGAPQQMVYEQPAQVTYMAPQQMVYEPAQVTYGTPQPTQVVYQQPQQIVYEQPAQGGSVTFQGASGSMPAPVQATTTFATMPAPVPTMINYPATQPAAQPKYQYPAGSTEVPVYSGSVNIQGVYQQPGAMRTIQYQQSQPMTDSQMKTIFPMGAPSTFQPFTASQYQYNIEGAAPTSYTQTMPAAMIVQQPAIATASTTMVQTVPSTDVVTTGTTTVHETTVPTKKEKKSKKLSSKKKQKGCC